MYIFRFEKYLSDPKSDNSYTVLVILYFTIIRKLKSVYNYVYVFCRAKIELF